MTLATRCNNHVLLAEDDRCQQLTFKEVLAQVDPSTTLSVVESGSRLLEVLLQEVPDLLFLDLNLPMRNGLDCLEEIRRQPGLQDLPVVVYSGSSQMSVIRACYQQQADLYLVKPFNPLHLQHALQSILAHEWPIERPKEKFYFMNDRFVPFTS